MARFFFLFPYKSVKIVRSCHFFYVLQHKPMQVCGELRYEALNAVNVKDYILKGKIPLCKIFRLRMITSV